MCSIYIMNSLQQAPKPTLEDLLKQLKLRSIEELIGGDAFNIDTLAKTTSLHPIVIREKLALLHDILTQRPATDGEKESKKISLKQVLLGWKPKGEEAEQALPDVTVGEGDILEILGRVGGGKSVLINEIVVECLKNNIQVIYLDGSNNLHALLFRIQQERQASSGFEALSPKLRNFSFKNQSELLMTLHSIGEWHSQHPGKKPWIIIDSLGRNDDVESQNPQASSTIEFKSAEKIRKLFFQLSLMVGAIVYATKTINLNSLFDTIYKHEKHRPRGAGSCAKKWDNLANKTICIDFGRSLNGQQHFWLNPTKGFICPVFKLKRYQ